MISTNTAASIRSRFLRVPLRKGLLITKIGVSITDDMRFF